MPNRILVTLFPQLIASIVCWVFTVSVLADTISHSNNVTCSSTSDCSVNSNASSLVSVVSSGSSGSDNDNPTSADTVNLTNGISFNLTTSISENADISIISTGGNGFNEQNAGNGGAITVDNSGILELNRGSSDSEIAALIAFSTGGNGDRDNKNNGSPGGNGGTGGNIAVTNNADIILGSPIPNGGEGIHARSWGGVGGEGNIEFGINQPGGDGGDGGSVTLTNFGDITMGSSSNPIQQGSRIFGLFAESLGGNADPDPVSSNVPASGAGGSANTVTITNNGIISVHSDGTGSTSGGVVGVMVNSKGGNGADSNYNFNNGGRGGSGNQVIANINDNISVSSAQALSEGGAGVKVFSSGGDGGIGNKQNDNGGQGGTGGTGGNLTISVNDSTAIYAQGDSLVGVLAKTLGGNGGSGNDNNNSSGGAGGAGGGIQINLFNDANITTNGDNGYGILGQSIGGFGGNGGDDTSIFGTAGGAGSGGSAAPIGAFTDAATTIVTSGDFAAAIAFQSIGGGGGIGGDFVDVLAGSGGNGGNGGDSGRAAINSSSTITTSGDHAYGLLAQSIAGSGGHGGVAAGIGVELGGGGGDGGTAGTGEILNFGNISTSGYAAHGMVLQSIAGGGGAAGSAGGLIAVGGNTTFTYTANGGDIDITNTAQVDTTGDAAIGIVAQSIGGGGGTGAGAAGMESVGGQGSAGGSGGSVTLAEIGNINTTGEMAHAVIAQSIGGGGGSGGNSFDFSVEIPSVGIGGSAAGGGDGGTVSIDNSNNPGSSSISTNGAAAIGLLAQSIGGGGGNGGDAGGFSGQALFNLKIGGNAGAAANGGRTSINYEQLEITTSSARSIAILAQSIGGGGGNGGAASGYDGGVGFAVGVSLGGSGGGGGTGSDANVTLSNSTISAAQALPSGSTGNQPIDAYGVVVQSIGGGGGNGGAATADDVAVAVPTGTGVSLALTAAVAVGGSSGSGGYGGAASAILTDSTLINTVGQGSHGVIVQSIGGGGGNGGNSSSLSADLGDEDTLGLDVGVTIGASGGGSGGGDTVTVSLGSNSSDTSMITTAGAYANAILAQSIGGGGGNGGVGSSNTYKLGGAATLKLGIGVGGLGATGGAGGVVNINHNMGAKIQTFGSGSRGILAQSIGGGGGTSQGGTVLLGGGGGGYSASVSVNVGRTGGTGGTGGEVTVNSVGNINTTGGDADAILAQSIGGGGGLGGSIGNDASADHQLSKIATLINDGLTAYKFNTTVGGQGGTGGNAGIVTVNAGHQVSTSGDWADGVVLQSIGGGGGVGGSATASGSLAKVDTEIGVGGTGGSGGDGGAVNANISSLLSTTGYSAYGVLAQSIGGGGGQGGDGSDSSNATVSVGAGAGVGGSGGGIGNGGTVMISSPNSSTPTINTQGDDAYAIVAQSIGGGGGVGGAGSSKSSSSVDMTVTIGGQGGSSGNGGSSEINGSFDVTTKGQRSFGLVAQSVGGGGGIGGAGNAANILSLTLGGQGGSGGDGGSVNITLGNDSSVHTSGRGAHAIVAQSIGGGGGIGGDSSGGLLNLTPYTSTINPDAIGDGANVSLDIDASIQTSGDSAFGILAQSIGGGGGFGGDSNSAFAGATVFSSGSSGAVTITQAGSIDTSGENSIAIFAQSDAPLGSEAINVTVNGTVTGGSGQQGVGVQIVSGEYNVLTIGSTGSVTASSGVAIRYSRNFQDDFLNLSVINNGTITGSVDNATVTTSNATSTFTAEAITIQNYGYIEQAQFIDAAIHNSGTLLVGHSNTLDSTEITGNLTQHSSGKIVVDSDFSTGSSDKLKVNGDALLDGKLMVAGANKLPDRELQILHVNGQLQNNLQIISPLFDYNQRQTDEELWISIASADFINPAASAEINTRKTANYVQNIWNAGGTLGLAPLFGALETALASSPESYNNAIGSLSLGAAALPAALASKDMRNFADTLMSCPTFDTASLISLDGSCSWAKLSGRYFKQNAHDGYAGFAKASIIFQMGAQAEFTPGWLLGVSAAYENSSFDDDNARVSTEGDSVLVGLTLRREIGALQLVAALTGGWGWFDSTRQINITGFDKVATSSPLVQNFGTRLRAAYQIDVGGVYIKPSLDFDAIYTHAQGYTESGSEQLLLDVASSEQWNLIATPAVEVGTQFDLNKNQALRTFARTGVSIANQDDWQSSARLQGAPTGTGFLITQVPLDTVTGLIDAGIEFSANERLKLRLQYDGAFSENTQSHTGSLRVSLDF